MPGSAPQPDAALRLLPEYDGRTSRSGKLVSGAPELVIEISHASKTYDLGLKLRLYQRAGVDEYIAFLIDEQRIEWRVFETGVYKQLQPDGNNVFRSRAFPGLWLDEPAFWRRDLNGLIAVLNQGLSSPEHAEFLARVNA